MSQADDTIGRHLDHLPFPVLIGDIGGTNARFALVADETGATERLPNVHTADFATIDDAIEAVVIDKARRPAAIGDAGAGRADRRRPGAADQLPLGGGAEEAVARFGLAEMVLLNDFEAQSLSLPGLADDDIDPIGGGDDDARTAPAWCSGRAPGSAPARWSRRAASGCRCRAKAATSTSRPVSERDFAIWPHIERTGGRIGAETLLCGSGMVRLYRAVCASRRRRGAARRRRRTVTEAGLSGADRQAAETLSLFATYLGRVAGDLALVFMADRRRVPRRRHQRQDRAGAEIRRLPRGLRRQVAAPALLERMATAIIVKEDAALAGIAAFARAPARFGVALDGRRWRG